jgi:hypothetical protein
MTRLTQRFTTPKLYLNELERISARWEAPKPKEYDVPDTMLPKSYGRVTHLEGTNDASE